MSFQLASSLEERCVLSWSLLYGSINECYIKCWFRKETLEIKMSEKRVVNGKLSVTHSFSCLCILRLLKLFHIYSLSRLHDWMGLPAKPFPTILLI